MATTNNKQPQAVFFKIISSLLKLANYSAHGDETLCACVFHCFHDNRQQKMPSGTFPYNYFFTSQTCKPCNSWKWNLVCMCISAFSWQPLTKKLSQALFPVTTSSLLKLAYHTMHGGETWYACISAFPWQPKIASGTFPVTTSSLLKLAHHTMHGGETWYTCVFQHFHDNHQQKIASGTFCCNYFFTSQTYKPCNTWK